MQKEYVSKENIIEKIVKRSKEKRDSQEEDKEFKMLLEDLKKVEDKLASMSETLQKVFKNIEKKDREINRLESRLSQKSQDSAIEDENKRIRRRIAKLESVLSEYGLIWIGDAAFRENSSDLEIIKLTGYKPNFERVKTSAEKLSNNAELRKKKRDENENCAIIDLVLYKDGIVVEKGPFRKYDTPSVTQFLRDIEEGYYPTELKEKYPEGVIFKIEDKITLNYDEISEKLGCSFNGKGQRLGKASNQLETIKNHVIQTATQRKLSLKAQDRRNTEEHTLGHVNGHQTEPVVDILMDEKRDKRGSVLRKSIATDVEGKESKGRKSKREIDGKNVEEADKETKKVEVIREKRRKSSAKGNNMLKSNENNG